MAGTAAVFWFFYPHAQSLEWLQRLGWTLDTPLILIAACVMNGCRHGYGFLLLRVEEAVANSVGPGRVLQNSPVFQYLTGRR